MSSNLITGPLIEYRIEQHYVAIPIQATLKDRDKTRALISEILDWISKKGLKPAGAPFYRYWCIGESEGEYSLEIGVPLEKMAAGDERMIASSIPEGSYVIALHKGHPDELENSVSEVEKWAQKQGLDLDKRWEEETEIWNGRFEQYLTDPDAEQDLFNWEIEISFLLLRDEAA